MTISLFQKGQIDKFLETHSEALFQQLCEKHKVDMDKLDTQDIFNLVGEIREINEGAPAGTYNKSKASPSSTDIPKPTAQAKVVSSYTPQDKDDAEDEQKTIEEYLTDLRACYQNCLIEIKTDILDKTAESCLVKCSLIAVNPGNMTCHFESFGFALKADEGFNKQKKYMIPLAETRAVKRACRLATIGFTPVKEVKKK